MQVLPLQVLPLLIILILHVKEKLQYIDNVKFLGPLCHGK